MTSRAATGAAAPLQVIRHGGTWHLLVVATMRTGCCDRPIRSVNEVASEIPVDGRRCAKLPVVQR